MDLSAVDLCDVGDLGVVDLDLRMLGTLLRSWLDLRPRFRLGELELLSRFRLGDLELRPWFRLGDFDDVCIDLGTLDLESR